MKKKVWAVLEEGKVIHACEEDGCLIASRLIGDRVLSREKVQAEIIINPLKNKES